MLELHGGQGAYKKFSKFEIQESVGAIGERAWQFTHTPNIKSPEKSSRIADLKLQGNKLTFQWKREALSTPGSSCLRNCMLSMKTGSKAVNLPMRKPVKIEPITIGEKIMSGKTSVKIEDMPDTANLKLTLLPFGQGWPVAKFANEQPEFPAVKGKQTIAFGETLKEFLVMNLASTGRSKLTVSLNSQVVLGEKLLEPYRGKKRIEDILRSMQAEKAKLENGIKVYKTLTRTEQDKRRQAKDDAQLRLNALGRNIPRVKGFLEKGPNLIGKKLRLAVVYQAGQYQVHLATPNGKPLQAKKAQ